jgi:hypothetical protein
MPVEKVRLRIGSVAKAVLITGQAYQDPKDALNEFVSNAADEYTEMGRRGERIRIVLRRRGRYPVVVVDDDGRGMTPERLREVARNLFKSIKADDDRTLGEKAIGLLAFQQLGARCDIVTKTAGSHETWVLKLRRGSAIAEIGVQRRRARSGPGTSIYLGDLDPEILRTITQRKVVDYLRRRRGPALAAGDYVIEVQEGRSVETVTPERPEGLRMPLQPQRTLWGTIEFNLYVAPSNGERRQVSLVGRAGTTIIDAITELEEFADAPWSSGQVAGEIAFAALQQTAGRRAVVRDREAFPVLVDAVRSVEPVIAAYVARVNEEVDRRTADRMSDTIRKVFNSVLRELEDLDNPMRSSLGSMPGEGAILAAETSGDGHGGDAMPTLTELTPHLREPPPPSEAPTDGARPDRHRSSRLPTIAVDPEPGERRSRFVADEGIVLYNDRHADFLLVKDDEAALVDYLASLVAKEYVVYNNPQAPPEELSEELIRMLVRVRRHLVRRRGDLPRERLPR